MKLRFTCPNDKNRTFCIKIIYKRGPHCQVKNLSVPNVDELYKKLEIECQEKCCTIDNTIISISSVFPLSWCNFKKIAKDAYKFDAKVNFGGITDGENFKCPPSVICAHSKQLLSANEILLSYLDNTIVRLKDHFVGQELKAKLDKLARQCKFSIDWSRCKRVKRRILEPKSKCSQFKHNFSEYKENEMFKKPCKKQKRKWHDHHEEYDFTYSEPKKYKDWDYESAEYPKSHHKVYENCSYGMPHDNIVNNVCEIPCEELCGAECDMPCEIPCQNSGFHNKKMHHMPYKNHSYSHMEEEELCEKIYQKVLKKIQKYIKDCDDHWNKDHSPHKWKSHKKHHGWDSNEDYENEEYNDWSPKHYKHEKEEYDSSEYDLDDDWNYYNKSCQSFDEEDEDKYCFHNKFDYDEKDEWDSEKKGHYKNKKHSWQHENKCDECEFDGWDVD